MSGAVPHQLAFGFAPDPSLVRADFILTRSNRTALAWVGHPSSWPAGRLVLSGPPGSGKTHIAAIFAHEAGAAILSTSLLAGAANLPELLPTHGSIVLEGADTAPEKALLHLLNLVAEAGGQALLTARDPATAWPIELADLRSRLAASGHARLGIPDQDLVSQVLAKAAADRQMRLSPALLAWLAERLPRNLSTAAEAVGRLDRAALAAGRPPDLRLARALPELTADAAAQPVSPSRRMGPLG